MCEFFLKGLSVLCGEEDMTRFATRGEIRDPPKLISMLRLQEHYNLIFKTCAVNGCSHEALSEAIQSSFKEVA